VNKNVYHHNDVDAAAADDDDAGGVYIMSGPRNVTVSEGQTTRLQCDVDGFPENISVDWLHGDSGLLLASTSTSVNANTSTSTSTGTTSTDYF